MQFDRSAPRVLVLDPNEDFGEAAVNHLKSLGVVAFQLSSLADAENSFRKDPAFDLVCIDDPFLEVPALHWIQSLDPVFQKMLFLVFIGEKKPSESVDTASNLFFLRKPFQMGELLPRIWQILREAEGRETWSAKTKILQDQWGDVGGFLGAGSPREQIELLRFFESKSFEQSPRSEGRWLKVSAINEHQSLSCFIPHDQYKNVGTPGFCGENTILSLQDPLKGNESTCWGWKPQKGIPPFAPLHVRKYLSVLSREGIQEDLRVLYLERMSSVRTLVRKMFTSLGIKNFLATDSVDLPLNLIDSGEGQFWDLVICDYQVDDMMSGIDFFGKLQKLKRPPQFVMSVLERENPEVFKTVGDLVQNNILVKPFDTYRLLKSCHRYLF